MRVVFQDMVDGLKSRRSVFSDIYERGLWGKSEDGYCSGSGSTDERIVDPYVDCVKALFEDESLTKATIVDLGCGDFRVGARIAGMGNAYIGVDIVPEVVASNQARHGTDRVRFRCLDIVKDDLPDGDVCLLRQVLQHLSNAEIRRVLSKLEKYRLIVLTEHQPVRGRCSQPNRDKGHGRAIRLSKGSGVFVELPPFGVRAGAIRQVLCLPASDGGALDDAAGEINTFIIQPPLW